MAVVLVVLGALLVATALADAANTLVSTRLHVGRWWPTERFYRAVWPVWRSLRHIRDERRREVALSFFAPASFLALLVLWAAAEIVGWSLVYWGLRNGFVAPLASLADALYFSGVTFFSVGFGDILPSWGVVRFLTLLEAFGGLGTLALVIGYLPALYSAYSARESQLLMLDDLTGERIMPTALIEAHTSGGELGGLYEFFREWERWCAQVLETHTSYPMLALFRSQHIGQSWVTGLGVVIDAATLTLACVPGAEEREPMFLFRRGNRLLHHVADRLGLEPVEPVIVDRSLFRIAYGRLAARGVVLRDFDEAFERLDALRGTYAQELESLIVGLLAPRGFWGHTVTGERRSTALGELGPQTPGLTRDDTEPSDPTGDGR